VFLFTTVLLLKNQNARMISATISPILKTIKNKGRRNRRRLSKGTNADQADGCQLHDRL